MESGGQEVSECSLCPSIPQEAGLCVERGDLEARSEQGVEANQEVNSSPMTWGPPGHGYIMVSPRAIVAFFSAVL